MFKGIFAAFGGRPIELERARGSIVLAAEQPSASAIEFNFADLNDASLAALSNDPAVPAAARRQIEELLAERKGDGDGADDAKPRGVAPSVDPQDGGGHGANIAASFDRNNGLVRNAEKRAREFNLNRR